MAESANVEILIEAFTDAAEASLEDVGDELNELSVEGEPAQALLDEVADELDDVTTSGEAAGQSLDGINAKRLALSMRALASQTDRAADELDDATTSAGTATAAFGALGTATLVTSGRMRSMSFAMVASLIPALVTLTSVLLPLVGVLGFVATAGASLAAVMGGLGIVGAVTHLDELKAALSDAREEIMRIVQPLGDVFGPLLVDAVEALPELVRRIVDSLGPLDQFADGLRDLGATAMEAIPALTGVMFDLAEQALPVVIDVLEWLMANGGEILDTMAEATATLGDELLELGRSTADLLGSMNELGLVAGEFVIPALADLFEVVADVIDDVLALDDSLRDLIIAGSLVAPIIFAIAAALGTLTSPLGVAIAAVAGFAALYRDNFMDIQDVTNDVLGGLMDTLNGLVDALRPAFEAVMSLIPPAIALFGEYRDIVGETLMTVIDGLMAFASTFRDAFEDAGGMEAVKELLMAIMGTVRTLHGVFQAAFSGIVGILNDNADGIADVVTSIIGGLSVVIGAVAAFVSDFSDAFQELGGGGAVSGLVESIIQSFQAVIGVVSDFVDALGPAGDAIGGALSAESIAAFAVTAIEALEAVVDVLRTVVLPAVRFVLLNFVAPLVNELARVWAGNFGDIARETSETISAIMSIIQPALQALAEFWDAHGQTILTAVRFAYQAIVGIIGTALDAILTTVLVFINILQGDWKEAFRLIADFLVDTFLGILNFVNEWGLVDAMVNAVKAAIGGIVALVTETLPNLFIQGLALVMTIVQNFGESLGNALIAIFNGVVGIIVGSINGLVETTTSAINDILATIDAVANEVSEIPGVEGTDLGRLDAATIDASRIQQDRGAIASAQDRQQNAEAIQTAVELTIEGSGALADLLREETSAEVESQRRQDARRTNRQRPERR
jgi:phage-related protein